MLILNFSHPLTEQQLTRITELAGEAIEDIRTIAVQIDQECALEPQVRAIVDQVGLSSQEWQTRGLLINPPGYAPAAFVLLAELHGRIGHFPTLIRLRPRSGPITIYEVAELLNLQTIREESRRHR
ncbi:MAG TPA: CRISPR-associated protein Csx15 [Ktedonobacteraceae bacterium]|nr:CRISPR-associated protein Csx15 [Ktedonobacteraceae bacterium]